MGEADRIEYRASAMQRRTFVQTTAAAAVLALFRTKLSFAKGSAVTDVPLLAPWTGPHGGFPPFDKIKVADIKPSLMTAMDLYRAELAAIASASEPPTFANTIAALEGAGRPFNRAARVVGVYRSPTADQ